MYNIGNIHCFYGRNVANIIKWREKSHKLVSRNSQDSFSYTLRV